MIKPPLTLVLRDMTTLIADLDVAIEEMRLAEMFTMIT